MSRLRKFFATTTHAHEHHPGRPAAPLSGKRLGLSALAAALLGILSACGSGGELTGGGGYTGEPGNGGGPGAPGSPGNPLAVTLEVTAHNHYSAERTETVCVSVPFPEGGYPDLDNVVVSGHQTAWNVMQRWPDGTVRVAQAQFTDVLPPDELKTYTIARDVPAMTGSFTRNSWVEQNTWLDYGAEVRDTNGVAYRAYATGAAEVLQETPLVQTRRYRRYHEAVSSPGIGRDYLTSTFYVTEFRDVPVVIVDWLIGNDYLGADNIPAGTTDPNMFPLGAVDVNEASFLVRGATGAHIYRSETETVAPPVSAGGGYSRFEVLKDTFLGDGQTRRYRAMIYNEHPGANVEDMMRWRLTASAMLEEPLMPLATHASWHDCGSAGLLGGPIAGPTDAFQRAENDYQSWESRDHFGTWGSRGDALKSATTGTPRNHPLSPDLAHAIAANHHKLLRKVEQMAWAQAMRPYHLFGLEVGAEEDILLWDGIPYEPGSRDLSDETLGRKPMFNNDPYTQYRTRAVFGGGRAHGWDHFDHEHWTMDLVFDYWTISGDAWAQEELRQLGQSLKALMRIHKYYTSDMQPVRAEGWTMQGFVQAYLATGDESIRDYAMRRVNEIVDPERNLSHPSRALHFQYNYPGTGYPHHHGFFMPWQHGALLYGYLGAYRFFREPVLLDICEDVITTVEYSWMSNYNDPHHGFIEEGLRYYTPVSHNSNLVPANYWDGSVGVHWGDSPLGGAHTFLIGGLHILASWSPDPQKRQRALDKARILLPEATNNRRWNKWCVCVPTYMLP